eukprot:1859176-Pleurochrysis_carterae.AAC.1
MPGRSAFRVHVALALSLVPAVLPRARHRHSAPWSAFRSSSLSPRLSAHLGWAGRGRHAAESVPKRRRRAFQQLHGRPQASCHEDACTPERTAHGRRSCHACD